MSAIRNCWLGLLFCVSGHSVVNATYTAHQNDQWSGVC